MSQLIGWNTLNCVCGRGEFAQVFKLNYHIKLGIASQPLGYQCLYCKRKVDTGQAMRMLQRDYLAQEIKEIEGEIEQISEPTPARSDPEVA